MLRAARFAAGVWLALALPAAGQSIEPRAYAPSPVGVNFAIVGWTGSSGALSSDPSLPLKNSRIDLFGPVFAYARTFGLLGATAKLDAILPVSDLSGRADYQGAPVIRQVSGPGDPMLRLSVNFVGAPAMDLQAFQSYRQNLIVGASVQVSAPLGQYDSSRLVNIGANRWWVKPEVGVSKAFGRWIIEQQASVVLSSANNDFFGGHRRVQDPIWSEQTHIIYGFRSGVWAAIDALYFAGGAASLDGQPARDAERNWRLGATVTLPVNRRNSFKLYGSEGVSARTGNGYVLAGVVWQRRWGGGI